MVTKQEIIDRCIYDIRIKFESKYVESIKQEHRKGSSKPLPPWIRSGEAVGEETIQRAQTYAKYFKDLKTSRNKDNQIPWHIIIKHGEVYQEPNLTKHADIITAINDFCNSYKSRELSDDFRRHNKKQLLISQLL